MKGVMGQILQHLTNKSKPKPKSKGKTKGGKK